MGKTVYFDTSVFIEMGDGKIAEVEEITNEDLAELRRVFDSDETHTLYRSPSAAGPRGASA